MISVYNKLIKLFYLFYVYIVKVGIPFGNDPIAHGFQSLLTFDQDSIRSSISILSSFVVDSCSVGV